MLNKIRNMLLPKSMFSRLVASFMAIIVIASLAYLFAYNSFIKIIEDEITRNINDRFDNDTSILNRYLEQIMATFLQCSGEVSFSPVVSGMPMTSYDQLAVFTEFRNSIYNKNQNEYAGYLKAAFIVTRQTGDNIVIESRGTYTRNNFYNVFFKSDVYNEQFWLNELNKNFVFKVYPEENFLDLNTINPANMKLTPIAFKKGGSSNYLIVALLNLNAVFSSASLNSKDIFMIYDRSGSIIYPLGMDIDLKSAVFEPDRGFARIQAGYLFKKDIPTNRLVYYKLVSDTLLKKRLADMNANFMLILLFSLFISLAISFLMASKFNNPVRQIVEIIKKSQSNLRKDSGIMDLQYIRDSVQSIVSDNAEYARDIHEKNSMLQEFFLQSRLKDIYLEIEDVESQLTIKQKYGLILLKVHYKGLFFERISEDTGKATCFFKEFLQLLISKSFPGTVTFQMENDQIISVINMDRDYESLEPIVEELKDQLKNEEEFAFFTIVVSDIYSDISQIKAVYNRLFELLKYRRLLPETQIVDERRFKPDNGKAYFSMQQNEQFSSVLQNGSLEDSLKLFNQIIDYNLKKEVNSFNFNLLCMEMINCAAKTLNGLFHAVPSEMDIGAEYGRIQNSSSPDEYRKVMETFIIKVVNYIKNNRKQGDYIIDYITGYVIGNYDKDIGLNDFAERLNLTNTYISSYFKDKMGVSLVDYINHFRINKAMELMKTPQLKVKDISVRVGMPNINTFIRAFKKYTGLTPKEYINQPK